MSGKAEENESAARFEENGACRSCEFLEDCRAENKPLRVSCWIRFCRDRYWQPMLKEK